MKLFAIVDKSGNLLVAKRNEKYAWMAAEDMHHSPMGQLQNEGYRCIELHTYDPSKQVVVDRDTLHYAQSIVRRVVEDGRLSNSIPIDEFLKSGDMNP